MAPVPAIKSWREARPYLENIEGTIRADVEPLLGFPGGAPFAICREVLCYLDHLAHLYTGRTQVGDRLREYLAQMMSKVDPHYGERAGEIYQMYRCGPMHEFAPKILENKKGELLAWLCYKGPRQDIVELQDMKVAVAHLEPVRVEGKNHFWLPVSTRCLVEDLLSSIEEFQKAEPENERVTAWNRAARALNLPEPFDFVIKTT